MTVPEERAQVLIAAAKESLHDVGERLWVSFARRGIGEDSRQEIHISWRCPTVAAAEQLEAALPGAGGTVTAAQPNAEAGGRGYGVAATVSFFATRRNLDDLLDRMIQLGAAYGAVVAGVGTAFRD